MEQPYMIRDEFRVKIDVKMISDTVVICNLYTGIHTSEIVLKRADFDYLVTRRFFKRDSDKQMQDATWTHYATETFFELPMGTIVE